jgi:hypothetical protein
MMTIIQENAVKQKIWDFTSSGTGRLNLGSQSPVP